MTVRKVRKLEELRENLILVPGVIDIFNKVGMSMMIIDKKYESCPSKAGFERSEKDVVPF